MSDNPETELVAELRALAGAPETDRFVVAEGDLAVEVRYSGGSSASLSLRVSYDRAARAATREVDGYRHGGPVVAIRPMDICVRPETADDVAHKEDGVDVEHQTGDRAFDDAVYIDAPSADPLRHVLSEEARAAILELFALAFTSVAIDDAEGNVVATIVSFTTLPTPNATERPGARALGAFARLARALPVVTRAAGEHAVDPLRTPSIVLWTVAVVSFFGSPMLYFGVLARDICHEDQPLAEALQCVVPGVVGVVVGLVATAIVGAFVYRALAARFRGTSSSSRRIDGVAGPLLIIVFSVVGTAIAAAFTRR